MCTSKPSAPKPPPAAPAAPVAPVAAEARTQSDRDRQRRAAAVGQSGTILTGSRGVTEQATTAQKTLLGQ